MENERILIVEDNKWARMGIKAAVESSGAGHRVIGEAASLEEVERLIDSGINPTVSIVDGRLTGGDDDGQKVAELIREKLPETIIIALSSEPQTYGDYQWVKDGSSEKLANNLTNLKH